MKLLDLFCGAGGAGMGYYRAGFDVIGVDREPQPDYPFLFVQADALEFVARNARFFDAIHASPPCQGYSSMRHLVPKERPRLIEPVRELLIASGKPYVIENVPAARGALRKPIALCGQYFGLGVRRHRFFECSFAAWSPECRPHHKSSPIAVYGDHPEETPRSPGSGGAINRAHTLEAGRAAMGIDWMAWEQLTQAIPPAYTRFIGDQLLEHLEALQRGPLHAIGPESGAHSDKAARRGSLPTQKPSDAFLFWRQ